MVQWDEDDEPRRDGSRLTIQQAADVLKSEGWSIERDEVGDWGALSEGPDSVIQIIFGTERIRDVERFSSTLSISTHDFSEVCSRIHAQRPTYWHIKPSWRGIRVEAPVIHHQHVRQASRQARAWQDEQNLDEAILDLARAPTNSPGSKPLLHLTALAIRGEIDTLRTYQTSFAAGDRLGFVPYITKDYIDRAVAIAETRSAAG